MKVGDKVKYRDYDGWTVDAIYPDGYIAISHAEQHSRTLCRQQDLTPASRVINCAVNEGVEVREH